MPNLICKILNDNNIQPKVIHKSKIFHQKRQISFNKNFIFIVLRFQLTHQHVLTEKEFHFKRYLYNIFILTSCKPNGAEKLMYGAHVVVWRQQ